PSERIGLDYETSVNTLRDSIACEAFREPPPENLCLRASIALHCGRFVPPLPCSSSFAKADTESLFLRGRPALTRSKASDLYPEACSVRLARRICTRFRQGLC